MTRLALTSTRDRGSLPQPPTPGISPKSKSLSGDAVAVPIPVPVHCMEKSSPWSMSINENDLELPKEWPRSALATRRSSEGARAPRFVSHPREKLSPRSCCCGGGATSMRASAWPACVRGTGDDAAGRGASASAEEGGHGMGTRTYRRRAGRRPVRPSSRPLWRLAQCPCCPCPVPPFYFLSLRFYFIFIFPPSRLLGLSLSWAWQHGLKSCPVRKRIGFRCSGRCTRTDFRQIQTYKVNDDLYLFTIQAVVLSVQLHLFGGYKRIDCIVGILA